MEEKVQEDLLRGGLLNALTGSRAHTRACATAKPKGTRAALSRVLMGLIGKGTGTGYSLVEEETIRAPCGFQKIFTVDGGVV